ncbi:MAG TPA: cytochrome c, partial [Puia sp.]|nr:cytochrome c [Puia sp.]
MTNRLIAKRFYFGFFLLIFIAIGDKLQAQDGKTLFQSNCASCHKPDVKVLGPALKGVLERVPDKKLLHAWIHNNQKVLSSGNKYFNALYAEYGKAPMNVFENLSDVEIDAILNYVETYKPPIPPGVGGPEATKEADNSLLYGILTIILAVIMLTLLQVNSNLKKLSDDKEGIPALEPIPFYRNKVYITFLILILFVIGGYYL